MLIFFGGGGQVVKKFYQDANIGQNVEVLFKGASITPQPQYTSSFENQWNKTDPNEVSLHCTLHSYMLVCECVYVCVCVCVCVYVTTITVL